MPNERLGAREWVVAVVSRDHPISRHVETECAIEGCVELSTFDFRNNCSSRFCVSHMIEEQARRRR